MRGMPSGMPTLSRTFDAPVIREMLTSVPEHMALIDAGYRTVYRAARRAPHRQHHAVSAVRDARRARGLALAPHCAMEIRTASRRDLHHDRAVGRALRWLQPAVQRAHRHSRRPACGCRSSRPRFHIERSDKALTKERAEIPPVSASQRGGRQPQGQDLGRRPSTPGHKLPSEAELIDEFGVSRTTVVREAVTRLRAEGLVRKTFQRPWLFRTRRAGADVIHGRVGRIRTTTTCSTWWTSGWASNAGRCAGCRPYRRPETDAGAGRARGLRHGHARRRREVASGSTGPSRRPATIASSTSSTRSAYDDHADAPAAPSIRSPMRRTRERVRRSMRRSRQR